MKANYRGELVNLKLLPHGLELRLTRAGRAYLWNVVGAYTGYARRRESNLALADVPKPEDVKQEALDRYIASIDFKWE